MNKTAGEQKADTLLLDEDMSCSIFYEKELLTAEDEKAGRGKLFYLTHSFAGEKKSPKNADFLQKLLLELAAEREKRLTFLLLREAAELVSEPFFADFSKKASLLGHVIYLDAEADVELSEDLAEHIRRADAVEAAELLLEYDVVTLS